MNTTATDLEQRTNEAAAEHQRQGGTVLGQLLTLRLDGCEVPLSEAHRVAEAVGLDAGHLPAIRVRSAVGKALESLGIHRSARHGTKSDRPADQLVGEGSALRYTRVGGTEGDILFSIREERVTGLDDAAEIHDREVQRLFYRARERELRVFEPLLRDEIRAGFARFSGLLKSDAIQRFFARVLTDRRACKLAGSAWFLPPGSEETVDRLRKFARELPGDAGAVSFMAVTILDEPGTREDMLFAARQSVEAELVALGKRLAKIREDQAAGVNVQYETVDRVLAACRELRTKLRSLETVLDLEVKKTQGELEQLDADVRGVLDGLSG